MKRGRSRPSSTIRRCTSSADALMPSVARATPAPFPYMTMKVAKVTVRKTPTARARCLTMYSNMMEPGPRPRDLLEVDQDGVATVRVRDLIDRDLVTVVRVVVVRREDRHEP